MKLPAFPALAGMVQHLQIGHAWSLGSVFGDILWKTLSARRESAILSVEHHLGLPLERARFIARESFRNTGRSFLELCCNRRIDPRFIATSLTVETPEVIAGLRPLERGVVAATAHFGAWEPLVGLIRTLRPDFPAQVVVRQSHNQGFDEFTTHLRTRPGVEIVGHRQAAPKVLACLKQHGTTAFLVDHNCRRDEAIFLPFLGQTAAVNMGPALLAVRSKALVAPSFLLREGKGKYRLVVHEPLDTATLEGSVRDRVTRTAEFYTAQVEAMVQSFPEQWFWMHNRWKTQPLDPEGQAEIFGRPA